MSGTWAIVTKETFFATMGPLNVHPRTERGHVYWERPNREVIGVSTPGYMCIGEQSYSVRAVTPNPSLPSIKRNTP